jgi:hypothetical protein
MTAHTQYMTKRQGKRKSNYNQEKQSLRDDGQPITFVHDMDGDLRSFPMEDLEQIWVDILGGSLKDFPADRVGRVDSIRAKATETYRQGPGDRKFRSAVENIHLISSKLAEAKKSVPIRPRPEYR